MGVIKDLQAVHDLVEAGWTQEVAATNDKDEIVRYEDSSAKNFCLMAAVNKVTSGDLVHGELSRTALVIHFLALAGEFDVESPQHAAMQIVHWNDAKTRTQAEVVALVQAAISIAKEETL